MTISQLQARQSNLYQAILEIEATGTTESEIDGLRQRKDYLNLTKQLEVVENKIARLSTRSSMHRQVRFG